MEESIKQIISKAQTKIETNPEEVEEIIEELTIALFEKNMDIENIKLTINRIANLTKADVIDCIIKAYLKVKGIEEAKEVMFKEIESCSDGKIISNIFSNFIIESCRFKKPLESDFLSSIVSETISRYKTLQDDIISGTLCILSFLISKEEENEKLPSLLSLLKISQEFKDSDKLSDFIKKVGKVYIKKGGDLEKIKQIIDNIIGSSDIKLDIMTNIIVEFIKYSLEKKGMDEAEKIILEKIQEYPAIAGNIVKSKYSDELPRFIEKAGEIYIKKGGDLEKIKQIIDNIIGSSNIKLDIMTNIIVEFIKYSLEKKEWMRLKK